MNDELQREQEKLRDLERQLTDKRREVQRLENLHDAQKSADKQELAKRNAALIAEKTEAISELVRECEQLADEADITFSVSHIEGFVYFPNGQTGWHHGGGWQSSHGSC